MRGLFANKQKKFPKNRTNEKGEKQLRRGFPRVGRSAGARGGQMLTKQEGKKKESEEGGRKHLYHFGGGRSLREANQPS